MNGLLIHGDLLISSEGNRNHREEILFVSLSMQ